ncbi:MAG: type II toxin-antitoxin system HipA family toxin [Pseudomonadota bacterium]
MTSNQSPKEAYVWIWLPNQVDPIIAGRLKRDGNKFSFNYGQSYLQRINDAPPAIPICEPELPLKRGILANLPGLVMPGCLRDAAPDAWGRRVIINKLHGRAAQTMDTDTVDELTYLLESGSDRIGALDFQQSPTEYIPRSPKNASLDELMQSAQRVEKGLPLSPELDQALYHGSSIGGARPKALIEDNNIKYIAKFSASNDIYSVVKAEFIAMRLAELVGLNVAPVQLTHSLGKDVLLIQRFDRCRQATGWSRKLMVSALTLFGLDDMMARYASYETLTEIIRHRFAQPKATLKELFSRLVFNILCGNTDDHARNHAAFWDGNRLTLTPAYDICPQARTGNEQGQAMLIIGNNNSSQLATCLEAAPNFLLTAPEATEIFEFQQTTIQNNWHAVCDQAKLSTVDRNFFWRRQFLNPSV